MGGKDQTLAVPRQVPYLALFQWSVFLTESRARHVCCPEPHPCRSSCIFMMDPLGTGFYSGIKNVTVGRRVLASCGLGSQEGGQRAFVAGVAVGHDDDILKEL